MALRHARAYIIAAGLAAAGLGVTSTAAAAPAPAGGGRPQLPVEFSASFSVVKLLAGAPASWPITAALPAESGFLFDSGATSVTEQTDATTGRATYTVTAIDSLPEGITVLLTEPKRSDGTLTGITCEDESGKYITGIDAGDEGWVDDGTVVGGHVSFATQLLGGVECTMWNYDPVQLTLTKDLDGTSAMAFPLAAIPETSGLSVGTGTTFDADGLFPTAGGATSDVNLVFSAQLMRSESSGTLLVGEALGAGYMFTGVACSEQLEQEVPALRADLVSDGPLYLVGGVVGEYVEINPWEDWDCTIANAIPGLSATKIASVTNPTPGTDFTYTITATNSGRTPLLDATLADPMPAGITTTAAASSAGTCTVAAGQVDCDLGDLAIGETRTITVNATVGSAVTDGQALTNTATVTGQMPAWDPALTVETPEAQETLVAAPTTHAVTATASVTIGAVVPTTTTQPPTTTAAPTTTTTTTIVVAQAAPTTTLPIPVVSPTTLPRTGGGVGLAQIALWTSVAGAALITVRRIRRRPA